MSPPKKFLARKASVECGRNSRRGFSLLEVTFAIGILSFCMIAIMGLVSVALRTSRQSIDRNLETRMLQTIRSELLQKPFSVLPVNGKFVFDGEAYRLEETEAIDSRKFYEASYETLSGAVLPAGQKSEKVVTCKVSIINLVRHETSTHAILLPDNGF